ncbi:ABC transporter ATP-binding protein [Actinospongicola halichondriae]|uniref:ABC transporter ATP-binding protein n=1 Tax=Actinospongicola halichondriae TaxID=3236844 RepID=UPI003D3CE06C
MVGTGEGIDVHDLSVSFDGTEVLHGVDLEVTAGQVTALLGPSGCGKTTLLRSIAGLEIPDAGTIVIGGRAVTGPGTQVAAEKRRVGMVFQDWALFPHLSVGGNVAFGLPRAERKGPKVEAALEMVGLGGFADRAPGTLSGGQQQRVALARALAPEPSALLLDEPFSNLDTALRSKVRTEVHELLHRVGITTVFVTHDQDEAFVLGDDVAVMSDGVIVQQAPPHRIYSEPADAWVARFVGDANLVPGTMTGAFADTAVGRVPVRSAVTGAVDVLLRPEDLRILSAQQQAEGACDAVVELAEYYGHDTVYVVALADGTQVRIREVSVPRFDRGDTANVVAIGSPAVAFVRP